jgi:hypothetical protein
MLYVSDHGESLGEKGIYLHGLPYRLAPETQKKVPMILWISDELGALSKLDRDCLAARKGVSLYHDNVFDSVLGLMDVRTSVYRLELDLFAGCRDDEVPGHGESRIVASLGASLVREPTWARRIFDRLATNSLEEVLYSWPHLIGVDLRGGFRSEAQLWLPQLEPVSRRPSSSRC